MGEGLIRRGFDLDLKLFEQPEGCLARLLTGNKLVEVKSDQLCRKTGNLFIEYTAYGKPSGMATTTADYWAFEYYDNRWLILPINYLKPITDGLWQNKRNRVKGGDYNKFEGVLISILHLVRPTS